MALRCFILMHPNALPVQVEASGGSSGSPCGKELGDDASYGTGEEVQWGAGLRDAEMLVWMGDFNYRCVSGGGGGGSRGQGACWLLLPDEAIHIQPLRSTCSARLSCMYVFQAWP